MKAVALALLAALLFGASTPASKLLLTSLPPLQLAGLLYLGAAAGALPLAWRDRRHRAHRRLDRANARRLLGTVVLGGIVAPVLLLWALRDTTSGSVALLLNLEMAFTAALGVLFFREHLGGLGWTGVACGLFAGAWLAMDGGRPGLVAGLLVAGACLAWGFDNHLTAVLDAVSPAEAVVCKGLAAGGTNLLLGLLLEPSGATSGVILSALVVGVLSYGLSIVLYVMSAQHLGATRAQVAFATAPFLGAGLSAAILHEPVGAVHLGSATVLVAGVVLLLLDRHSHAHVHPALEHIHSHRHDDAHHDHTHAGLAASVRHTHLHVHEPVTHVHRHLPDLHHRHEHG